MSDQQQQPKTVSWADKIRLAKEQSSASSTTTVDNTPAAVIVAPEIKKSGDSSNAENKIDTTHTLFTLPDSEKGTLVLDTNAFIKGFDNFLQTADVFVTTAAVIQECRDRKTRDLLDRLPVAIEILEPSNESLKKVIHIAERTGDIGMLSKTDLELCALAFDVAKQKEALLPEITPGTAPVNSTETIDVSDSDEDDEFDSDADSFDEEGEEEEESDDDDWLDASSSSDDDKDGKKKKKKNNKKKKEKKDSSADKKKKEITAVPTTTLPGWGSFDDDWGAPDQAQENALSKRQQKKLAKQQKAQGGATAESETTTSSTNKKEESEKEQQEKQQQEQQAKETQVEQLAKAKAAMAYTGGFSAVTSDFPMQNVLLHCGVPTVGSSGQCIKELRVWVLRCHACAAIVHDTLRQFCPECGSGDTLKRVHYVMNDKGEKHLFVNFRYRINTRGTIFNLSKPRGGRKGTNKTMVLREDQLRNCGKVDARQRFMNQRSEIYGGGAGGDDEDGLAGFGERDARAGRRDGNFMMDRSSYKKRNVNELRKVRASRKR